MVPAGTNELIPESSWGYGFTVVQEQRFAYFGGGLVPLGNRLVSDARCTLVQPDFFALAASAPGGFVRAAPSRLAHGVLLDIDHSPEHWLNSGNSAFYTRHGLGNLADKLHPGGIFGLWSNDPPDDAFNQLLDTVFATSETHVVTFPNPYTGEESSNTIYLARKSKP